MPSTAPPPPDVPAPLSDPASPQGWGWTPPVAPRRRRGRWRAPLLVLALATASWSLTAGGAQPLIDAGVRAGLPGLSAVAGIPSPGFEEAPAPIAAPAPLTGQSPSYALLPSGVVGQAMVAYDPCRPIHYVVSGGRVSAGGALALSRAIARVSAATGLRFVDDGPTDELPTDHRSSYQPRRYGDRWVPVLISWTRPDQDGELHGDVIGDAGSVAVQAPGGPAVYVTGEVRLDVDQITSLLARPDGVQQVQAVIEHELGHLVGLAHVHDPTQLMYPTDTGAVTDYAAGDLTGLALLGQGPCVRGI